MENLPLKSIEKQTECVILIHGLARTSRCMNKAGTFFSRFGYDVINLNYPSRQYTIRQLVSQHLHPVIQTCETKTYKRLHFLTHSMGAILLRYFLSTNSIENLGNSVMLAPPNQGSEIVDKLAHLRLFYFLNGPAGLEIGTDSNSVPMQLGKLNFDVGILTGNKSLNPLLSRLIPGVNDGKVAVDRAKMLGMKDFLVVPYTHSFIMQRPKVIFQALYFIQNGVFYR